MVGDIAHVCNRGVEKRKIFLDKQDYSRFVENLYFLNNIKGKLITERKNIFETTHQLPKQNKLVEIFKWSALPNHYHLLLYEVVEGGILEFVKRLGNAYTKYFNNKSKGRSGYLFQNSAKIIRLESDAHYLYLPFYIDLNIIDLCDQKFIAEDEVFNFLTSYQWSSLRDYYKESHYLPIINRDLFYESFNHDPKSYKRELLDLAGLGVGEIRRVTRPLSFRQ